MLYAALGSVALALAAGCGAAVFFERCTIDPRTLSMTLAGPIASDAAAASYFERYPLEGGTSSVNEYRSGERKVAYELTKENKLRNRTKYLRVLEGAFGDVFLEITSWYPPERGQIVAKTYAYYHEVGHQAPKGAQSVPTATLASIAIVRVLRAAPKYLVVSADYSLSGELKTFHVDASTGAWVHSNEVARYHPFEGGHFYGPGIDWGVVKRLGFPERIEAQDLLKYPWKSLGAPGFPVELDAVLAIKNRGTLIERLIRRGKKTEESTIAFPLTELEKVLAPVEATLPFGPGA